MLVGDVIYNDGFDFNANYAIYKYKPDTSWQESEPIFSTAKDGYGKPLNAILDLKVKYMTIHGKVLIIEALSEPEDTDIAERIVYPNASVKEDIAHWIIAVANSSCDGVVTYKFNGTENEVKLLLLNLLDYDRAIDIDSFDYGTENIKEIENNGEALNAYAYYADYHINYTAKKLSAIPLAIKGYTYTNNEGFND